MNYRVTGNARTLTGSRDGNIDATEITLTAAERADQGTDPQGLALPEKITLWTTNPATVAGFEFGSLCRIECTPIGSTADGPVQLDNQQQPELVGA